jgi:soluble lytic murein transglycosylase-like protein
MSDLFGVALGNAAANAGVPFGNMLASDSLTSGSLHTSIDTALPEVWNASPSNGAAPLQPLDLIPSNSGVGTEELDALVLAAAGQTGVDALLLRALVNAESGWNPNAVSPNGRQGLMGLPSELAREIGVIDPFDPKQATLGGAKYLKQLIDRFGSAEMAVAAYQAGPGAVARHKGVPPFAETRSYVDRVMSEASR